MVAKSGSGKKSSVPVIKNAKKKNLREILDSVLENLTLLKNLLLVIIYLTTSIIIILIFFLAIFHSDRTIELFSVSKLLNDKGYTSQYLTRQIMGEIDIIRKETTSILEVKSFSNKKMTSLESLKLPGSDLSLNRIVKSVRSFFNMTIHEYPGNVYIFQDDKYKIEIFFNNHLIEKIILPGDNSAEIARECAEAILKHASPFNLALYYKLNNQAEKADLIADYIFRQKPEKFHPWAYYIKADLHSSTGKYEKAIEKIKQGLAINKNNYILISKWGQILSMQAMYKKDDKEINRTLLQQSVQKHKTAWKKAGNKWYIFYYWAISLRDWAIINNDIKKYEETFAMLKKAEKISPKNFHIANAFAYTNYLLAYPLTTEYQLHYLNVSARYYEKAYKLNPTSRLMIYSAGYIYKLISDLEIDQNEKDIFIRKASNAFETTISIDRSYISAYLKLSESLKDLKKTEEALEILQKAETIVNKSRMENIRKQDHYSNIYLFYGHVYVKKGDIAREELQNAAAQIFWLKANEFYEKSINHDRTDENKSIAGKAIESIRERMAVKL